MPSTIAPVRCLLRVAVATALELTLASVGVHASDLPVHVKGGVDAIHADSASVVSPRAEMSGEWTGGEAGVALVGYAEDTSVRHAWSLGGSLSDSVARRTRVSLEFTHYLGAGFDGAWAAQVGPGVTLAPGRSLSVHGSLARAADGVKSRGVGLDYEHQIRESWGAGTGVSYETSSDGSGFSFALSTDWTPLDALELTSEIGASENGAGLTRLPGRIVGESQGRGRGGSGSGRGSGGGGARTTTTTTSDASNWKAVFQLGLRVRY